VLDLAKILVSIKGKRAFMDPLWKRYEQCNECESKAVADKFMDLRNHWLAGQPRAPNWAHASGRTLYLDFISSLFILISEITTTKHTTPWKDLRGGLISRYLGTFHLLKA
jgi:hypothetical protein